MLQTEFQEAFLFFIVFFNDNCFNNFIKNTINHSGSSISLKIFIFLKNNLLQHTAREARIVSASGRTPLP